MKIDRTVAKLGDQDRSRGAGYALSGELWRQHSWGMRDDSVIETTARRTAYFGLVLQADEAARFASLDALD